MANVGVGRVVGTEPLATFGVVPRPFPVNPADMPFVIRESDDARGHAFVIHCTAPVQFDDGAKPKKTLWFQDKSFGSRAEAKEAAWSYFRDRRTASSGEIMKSGRGPLKERSTDGLFYHGGRGNTFTCYTQEKNLGLRAILTARWEVATETMHKPGDFCSSHEYVRSTGVGTRRYFCRGHTTEEDGGEEAPS